MAPKPVVCQICKNANVPYTSEHDEQLDRVVHVKYDERGEQIPEQKYRGYRCSNGHTFEILVSED